MKCDSSKRKRCSATVYKFPVQSPHSKIPETHDCVEVWIVMDLIDIIFAEE
jgi:hypothetical protein